MKTKMTPEEKKARDHEMWLKWRSNPENIIKEKEYQKKWRENHKDYHKNYQKNMTEEQKQRRKEYQERYRQKNREKLNKWFREYYKILIKKKNDIQLEEGNKQ